MPFLLDTNILSELRKGDRCDSKVARWAVRKRGEAHYISVLSLGEIRKGIELLRSKSPDRCDALEVWLRKLRVDYASCTVGITPEIAERWGKMCSLRPLRVIDSLLAATAFELRLTLATRNTSDFDGLGIATVDPFQEP
jgi:hypothetical protein